MKDVLDYLKEHTEEYLDEMKEFIRIESISTDGKHKKEIHQAADFASGLLKKMGLKNVKKYSTKGYPVIYGDWLAAKGKPTVLIYGHYDVQPVEPLDLWKTPPFEATIDKGKIFGRGTADDKGQLLIHLKTVEAFLKTGGELPVNVKFLIEGEEEIGSTNLAEFVKKNKQLLKCDVILISDTHMQGKKMPSITYGLRGLTYLEMTVKAAGGDLHSGTFGGSIANPIQVLAEILTQCKNPKTGKIKIPGFYDDVIQLTRKERTELAKMPHDDGKYAKSIGAVKPFGEAGYSTVERTGARPTFEVNGIWGGHTGDGVKTVLPAKAHAKVSMRLVANQNPDKIARLFKAHVKNVAPDTVKVEVNMYDNNGYPALSPLDSIGMKAAANAIRTVYGTSPYYTREGGSIPVVADFQQLLGVPAVLLGFGLPDDNLHAPNEKLDLSQFSKGLATSAHFLVEFAALMKTG